MPLVTKQQARDAARSYVNKSHKSLSTILKEGRETDQKNFDIFLSHSYIDKELVFGAKVLLEEQGKSVYVDWIEDQELDREKIDERTAHRLRVRMRQSDALFYAYSVNSTNSRWMPWELGYFDGLKGKVAVFPIVDEGSNNFLGQEYLNLYPYVDITSRTIWLHADSYRYVDYSQWMSGRDPRLVLAT